METHLSTAPLWWLLLLKTHWTHLPSSSPLSLSNDVRPPPELISCATESSSTQAGSLLWDIPSLLLFLGNMHPISQSQTLAALQWVCDNSA